MFSIGKPDIEKLKSSRNIKGLEKALGYTNEAGIRKAAAEAIGQLGDISSAQALLQILNDREGAVRKAAVDALDRIGWQPQNDKDSAKYWVACQQWDRCVEMRDLAVDALVAVLGIKEIQEPAAKALGQIGKPAAQKVAAILPDILSREAAMEALGTIADEQTVQPLLSFLIDPTFSSPASKALIRMDGNAVPGLVAALSSATYSTKTKIIEMLGDIGDRRAVEALIREVDAESSTDASAAACALGKIGDERAVPALISVLEKRRLNTIFRAPFVEALGKIGDKRAEDQICAYLIESSNDFQAKLAIQALRNISSSRATGTLLSLVQGQIKGVTLNSTKGEAVEALYDFGNESVVEPLLGELEKTRDIALSSKLVRPIGKFGKAGVIDRLMTALLKWNQQTDRIYGSASSFGESESSEYDPAKYEFVKNSMTEIDSFNSALANALGEIGSPAIEKLMTALQNSSVERSVAEKALAKIGVPAEESLIALMMDDKQASQARSSAAWTLGLIGDEHSMAALKKGTNCKDDNVVKMCIRALNLIQVIQK